jgi:hypothetical protein
MSAHQTPAHGLGSRVEAELLAARVRLGRNVPSRAVLTHDLLDKRETDAEHVGNGALGTESPLPSAENLLTEIK